MTKERLDLFDWSASKTIGFQKLSRIVPVARLVVEFPRLMVLEDLTLVSDA